MQSFIGNVKLKHKFLLIGAIAALMLALPSALIVGQADGAHSSATKRIGTTDTWTSF